MSIAEVRTLFAYDDWANARLHAAVAELTEEQFTRRLESSFPSVQETVAHLVLAEWVWLRRWLGESPTAQPAELTAATPTQLRHAHAEIQAQRAAYLATVTEEQLDGDLTYRNLKGEEHRNTLADLFRHVVNHSTYHRGQAATLLRQVGSKAPATDFVLYRREAG
jgi:uncharacterized damage-inducible protein DinB